MRQRGFSLIELIVVITVIGLLLVSLLPSVGAWMRNTRIRNIAESIRHGLDQARNEAVRTNASVSFWLVSPSTGDPKVMSDTCRLSSSSGAWVISVASPVGVCATNRSSFVAAHPVGDSGTGLTVSAVDATKPTAKSATSVTFNGFGQVANASTAIASVSVTSAVAGSRALTVQVSASGRVRTCDPLTASSDPRSCL